jgi:hypothetical protein
MERNQMPSAELRKLVLAPFFREKEDILRQNSLIENFG